MLRGSRKDAPDLDATALEASARTELGRLTRELASHAEPPAVALDNHAAASKTLEGHEHPIDLLGALVLAWRGQAELEGGTARPCLFDPRHGPGRRTARWPLGGADADIPACRACAKAITKGRAPDVVQDRGRDYFTQDTVWGRAGFGALDEDLAGRVLRGG